MVALGGLAFSYERGTPVVFGTWVPLSHGPPPPPHTGTPQVRRRSPAVGTYGARLPMREPPLYSLLSTGGTSPIRKCHPLGPTLPKAFLVDGVFI
jgi:hypothetical protein